MDQLLPQHVPVYQSAAEREEIWERCVERTQPVIAVRDAERGYIVRYDLQHLDRKLDAAGMRELRDRSRGFRSYPTGTDPISESEGVGGEAGPVSGDLHADSETDARRLASRISAVIFDQGYRTALS